MKFSKNGRHLTLDKRAERNTASVARVVKSWGGPENQWHGRAGSDKLLIRSIHYRLQ